jgi:hypothetical protein
MEPQYPLLKEGYDKYHQARYIEEGQVTRIVNIFSLIFFDKCA